MSTGLATLAVAQETPVLRVNTRLVEVDVVVHSKGSAVEDLKQDDFTVLDNGKPQKIAAFNVVSSKTTAGKSIALPPGTVSNRIVTSGPEPAGTTIVLYDTLNTAAEDQSWARQELLRYLGTLERGDQFALYLPGKSLQVIQDFQDDPKRILQAARRSRPESSADRRRTTSLRICSSPRRTWRRHREWHAAQRHHADAGQRPGKPRCNHRESDGLIAKHLQDCPGGRN
jgi:VWFA-related protein